MIDVAGENFRRNLLFRHVTRPVPSTLTQYWSWGRTSVTVPVLSQRWGLVPTWFCMKQRSPTLSGDSWRACSLRDSEVFANLTRRACSLAAHASRHSGRTASFENLASFAVKGNTSRSGRPKMIWAGDNPQSGSGVFLSCSSPLSYKL